MKMSTVPWQPQALTADHYDSVRAISVHEEIDSQALQTGKEARLVQSCVKERSTSPRRSEAKVRRVFAMVILALVRKGLAWQCDGQKKIPSASL